MKASSTAVGAIGAVLLTLILHSPAQAQGLIWAYGDAPQAITAAHPSTVVRVHVAATAGSPYDLTWELWEYQGPGRYPGGTSSGVLAADSSAEFAINPSGVPDGFYQVRGTLTVQDPVNGEGYAPWYTDAFAIHRNGPEVSQIKVDHPTIYPRIATNAYPATADIVFVIAGSSSENTVEVRNAAGAVVSHGEPFAGPSGLETTWSGRYAVNGSPAPPGSYSVVLEDQFGNEGSQSATVVVSTLHRIRKTFRVTVSAAGSLEDKYVGRCSQLRKPALRRWSGSLGFYANTRCKTQTWTSSAVSTSHAVQLPAAFDYRRLEVDFYGGAARSRPSSRAYLRMLSNKRRWTTPAHLTRSLGTHTGFVATERYDQPGAYVFSDRYIVWGFVTAYKDRYDVKNFTVTAEYDVLGN